jgi:serine/threonine protein phosphatase PrpC
VTAQETIEVSMNIRYGVSEAVGYREQMEDASAIWDIDEEGLFAAEVYDGHSGPAAALAAAKMMTPCLRSLMKGGKRIAMTGLVVVRNLSVKPILRQILTLWPGARKKAQLQ